VPPNEASCVLGKGGNVVREIGAATGTRVATSGRNEFYPGTQLQELKIQGNSPESVLNAAAQVLTKIAEMSGTITGGDAQVEPGGARLKVVVPYQVAASVIGPRGATVKAIREKSGMIVHIEETLIPPGPPSEFTEQAVCLSGPLEGAGTALTMIVEVTCQFMGEPWFEAWCAGSHCGMPVPPGFVLFTEKGKGKGKDKGKGAKGGCYGGEDYGGGYGKGKGYGGMDGGCYGDMGYGGGGCDGGKGCGGGMGCGGGKGSPDLSRIPAGLLAAKKKQYGGNGHMEASSSSGGGVMAVKMLVSQDEVGVLGHDPSTMQQIQQATGTVGMLSEGTYPGTLLQELTVQGPSGESVFNAVLGILNKIGEAMGVVAGGDMDVQQGEARVKLVVPKRAAAAIIGPGGQMVKQIKVQTGVRVHVDMNPVPCMDQLFEQAIILAGKFEGIQSALYQVVTEVSNFSREDWFQPWAEYSNTGREIPGLILYEGFYRGKGGKGGKE